MPLARNFCGEVAEVNFWVGPDLARLGSPWRIFADVYQPSIILPPTNITKTSHSRAHHISSATLSASKIPPSPHIQTRTVHLSQSWVESKSFTLINCNKAN